MGCENTVGQGTQPGTADHAVCFLIIEGEVVNGASSKSGGVS